MYSFALYDELREHGPPAGPKAYRRVDSCAGEVAAASNYYYSTTGEADSSSSSEGSTTSASVPP